jgi:hypothetical protein
LTVHDDLLPELLLLEALLLLVLVDWLTTGPPER